LFSVDDADGDPIVEYAFWDEGTDAASGYFSVDGVRQAPGRAIAVAATDLSKVQFVGGAVVGNEMLWVKAFDGGEWSRWKDLLVATQVS
ncbi:MAG: hypothetical protein AB7Q97_09305, partial [Gammaproteobacteria bacterium]